MDLQSRTNQTLQLRLLWPTMGHVVLWTCWAAHGVAEVDRQPWREGGRGQGGTLGSGPPPPRQPLLWSGAPSEGLAASNPPCSPALPGLPHFSAFPNLCSEGRWALQALMACWKEGFPVTHARGGTGLVLCSPVKKSEFNKDFQKC